MKKAYKFRVILDCKEDIFRDVEVLDSHCLEDFHQSILNAFGIQNGEMAAFYKSDEDWQQGEEIPLLDMGMTEQVPLLMCDHNISGSFSEEQKHMLYVYDFLSMWTFFVELIMVTDAKDEVAYPHMTYAYGETPESAPEKSFEGGEKDLFEDAFGDEEDGEFGSMDESEGLWG